MLDILNRNKFINRVDSCEADTTNAVAEYYTKTDLIIWWPLSSILMIRNSKSHRNTSN